MADLTPYGDSSVNRHLQENCCMTACVSKSPSKTLRRGKGRVGDEWSVCLSASLCAFEGQEAGGEEKGKIS